MGLKHTVGDSLIGLGAKVTVAAEEELLLRGDEIQLSRDSFLNVGPRAVQGLGSLLIKAGEVLTR